MEDYQRFTCTECNKVIPDKECCEIEVYPTYDNKAILFAVCDSCRLSVKALEQEKKRVEAEIADLMADIERTFIEADKVNDRIERITREIRENNYKASKVMLLDVADKIAEKILGENKKVA